MSRGSSRLLDGRYYARARYGNDEQLEVRVPWARSRAEAKARGALIGEIAHALATGGRGDLVKATAKKLAEATDPKAIAMIRRAVSAILKGATSAGAARETTIRQWGQRYTSGELAKKHPDHVKLKDYSDDESRLRLYVYPLVGDVPVYAFTLAHGDLVMAKLPPEKVRTPAARRHVAQVLSRLLNLAVFPGRLIGATPLPRGWLPKIPKGKHHSCLFPKEEAALLACEAVPLVMRLFCGVLNREGMRVTELWDSEWWQWNLEVGTFTATKTKTGDPRMWALRPDVARAMKAWKAKEDAVVANLRTRYAVEPSKTGPFTMMATLGGKERLAERFRIALKAAGVSRAELFATTDHTARLRAHDMRATFVTLSLAEGRTETWVRDRTAHKTTTMIDKYRRLARQVAELNMGPLVDLDVALDLIPADTLHLNAGPIVRGYISDGAGDLPGDVAKIATPSGSDRLKKYRRRDSNPHDHRSADFESTTHDRIAPGRADLPGETAKGPSANKGIPRGSPGSLTEKRAQARRPGSAADASTEIALAPSFLRELGGGRVTLHLPDGTTLGTDVDRDEDASAIAERLADGLRRAGHPAQANGSTLSGPPMRLVSRGRS